MRPLCYTDFLDDYIKLGQKFVAASESRTIDDKDNIKPVGSGQKIVVHLKDGLFEKVSVNPLPEEKLNRCLFEMVYFSNDDSVFDGVCIDLYRYMVGEALFEILDEKGLLDEIDHLIPIPHSGLTYGEGTLSKIRKSKYHITRLDLIKNILYRTFIQSSQEERELAALQKYTFDNSTKPHLKHKTVLGEDDSSVRSTTDMQIVIALTNLWNGFVSYAVRKITFARASPRVINGCEYGVDMHVDEMVAVEDGKVLSEKEIVEKIKNKVWKYFKENREYFEKEKIPIPKILPDIQVVYTDLPVLEKIATRLYNDYLAENHLPPVERMGLCTGCLYGGKKPCYKVSSLETQTSKILANTESPILSASR